MASGMHSEVKCRIWPQNNMRSAVRVPGRDAVLMGHEQPAFHGVRRHPFGLHSVQALLGELARGQVLKQRLGRPHEPVQSDGQARGGGVQCEVEP